MQDSTSNQNTVSNDEATPRSPGSPGSPAGATFWIQHNQQRTEIIDRAYDYRGDVTLTLNDDSTVTGYLFDRQVNADSGLVARLILSEGGKQTIEANQIKAVQFSDRDPAAGKSWETWVKKYAEKKRAESQAPQVDASHTPSS